MDITKTTRKRLGAGPVTRQLEHVPEWTAETHPGAAGEAGCVQSDRALQYFLNTSGTNRIQDTML